MWSPGPTELIIILVIIVLLFGAGKLPSVLKEVGEGLRHLKQSTKDSTDDATKP